MENELLTVPQMVEIRDQAVRIGVGLGKLAAVYPPIIDKTVAHFGESLWTAKLVAEGVVLPTAEAAVRIQGLFDFLSREVETLQHNQE